MADAVNIVNAVSQILSTSIGLCQNALQLLQQIDDAPQHITAVKSDLYAFYSLLNKTQTYLSNTDTQSGLLHPATKNDVKDVLKDCLSTLQSLNCLVTEYKASNDVDDGAWQQIKSIWKEKEISQLREQLAAHKTTLNVVVAAADLVNTIKTEATSAQIDQQAEDVRSTLAQLLSRLDQEEELASEDAVVRISHETTMRRIANDAATTLTSVNPNEEPRLSVNIDRIVSTLASGSRPTEADEALNPSPDIEYDESSYHLSLRFHGSPDHVKHIKQHFRTRASNIKTKDLSMLCQAILKELTEQDSPGIRMDFHFHHDMYDLPQLRAFLIDQMGFTLPDTYESGDIAALSSHWLFWLHSLAETTYSGITKTSMSEDDSNRWRMTFMRRLDDLDTSVAGGQIILHRRQEKLKDARLPDVYGYSTHWKTLRDQFAARKQDSPVSDSSSLRSVGCEA